MVTELRDALADAEKNPQVRCVVLTGAGDVFSAGQDISEMKQGDTISYREHLDKTYNPLILQIRSMGKARRRGGEWTLRRSGIWRGAGM